MKRSSSETHSTITSSSTVLVRSTAAVAAKRASFGQSRNDLLEPQRYGSAPNVVPDQHAHHFNPPTPPLYARPRPAVVVRSPSPPGNFLGEPAIPAANSMSSKLSKPDAVCRGYHRSASCPESSFANGPSNGGMPPSYNPVEAQRNAISASSIRASSTGGCGLPIVLPLEGETSRQSNNCEKFPKQFTDGASPRTVAGGDGDGQDGGDQKRQKKDDSRKDDSTGSSGNDEQTSKDYYFDSYSHHGIHEEMLKDEVRTRTYQMAVLENKHLFEGKTVLDVGCGSGILSMFCAQAGAAHVYGIDCSSIIDQARKIVDCNGFSDKITLIKGKVEEVELPVDKVDIIISEWMGYFLLYESMLDTVIYARDKWLRPGGLMFPDKAVMYLCAIEDAQVKHERIDFWDNVYGFDMTPLKEIALTEPVVDVVDANHVLSDSQPILNVDILTCTKEDLAFTSSFRLRAQRNDYVHGFAAYFECAFTQVHKPIGFSTAPFAKYTHWKQTVFYTRQTLTICEGEDISGTISCKPNPNNNRDLDISMDVVFDGQHSKMDTKLEYRLR